MKAYVLQVLVIDSDDIQEDAVISAIQDTKYPNRCISPTVIGGNAYDIGEWSDDHPLNRRGCDVKTYLELYARKMD